MPWSAKAQELLRSQYAAVGATARAALGEAVSALEAYVARSGQPNALLDRYRTRAGAADAFVAAYRRYCWPVNTIDDFEDRAVPSARQRGRRPRRARSRLAHGDARATVRRRSALLFATPIQARHLGDEASETVGLAWWERADRRGRRGHGRQAAVMARTRVGAVSCNRPSSVGAASTCASSTAPEYTVPEHLERLRARG